jgi:hypothetical protein
MPVDLLLDENFEILIEDGDFVPGESTRQHQTLLLYAEKGEIREFPTRGVGVRSWLLDERPGDLNAQIKREYEADGMTVLQVKSAARTLDGVNLTIEAVYD